MFNILYFGSFSKPYDTEVYVANTLEQLGHFVNRYETPKMNRRQFEGLLAQNWDCVLFSKGWFDFSEVEVLEILSRYKGLTMGWFWDLCWETNREEIAVRHHLFRSKVVLTSDGGHQEQWEKFKMNHRTLRQGIYSPEAVLGTPKEKYKYDVAFVGSMVHEAAYGWKHRSELINFLKLTYGERFKLFGNGEEIRNLELNDLYASVKVVVGDSVYSPNYWSNRLYETLGRGGFLIFPKIEGLEKEVEYYKHLVPYQIGDWKGLREKIDYYLTHDNERNKIRLAGFEHCKKNLTYEIRCKELVKIIEENKV